VQELAGHDHTVIGMGLFSAKEDIAHLMTDYLAVDLRQRWPLIDCDAVVHLAALSAVGPSFNDPQRYIEANSAPMTHLWEALLTMAGRVRVVVVSTGAVYHETGNSSLHEAAPIIPSSPYIVILSANSSQRHKARIIGSVAWMSWSCSRSTTWGRGRVPDSSCLI
jgi:GDP-4-dehydro-6-deoxy-D-mannose reductase